MKITKEMQSFADGILLEYETEDKPCPKELRGRVVMHIYPQQDTITDYSNQSEGLLGFFDALLFNVHIFHDGKRYILEGHDQIDIEIPCWARIFKDGSTMFVFPHGVRLGIFQSLTVMAANKPTYIVVK